MTTTGTTTEPSRERRGSFSVRTRITATVAALTTLAMVLVGLLLHSVATASMRDSAAAAVSQEFEEFRTLWREGIDPVSRDPFTVPSLLERFLSRNVPDDDEVLVTYSDDRAVSVSAGRSRAAEAEQDKLLSTPQYAAALDKVLADGGTERIEDSDGDEVWVSALPVRSSNSTTTGALVVVTFFGDDQSELAETMRTYALASALTLMVITGLAWFQAGRLLAPIRVLRATTQEIGARDLSRRIPETGNDDVTELTRAINQMLGRLEEGFEAQRRFLDDAGHELRTPLTVLAGHLELLDPNDPEEVEASRDLLLDETDRMGRLVQDLITLTKARRPDFLSPAPADIDDLTRDVFAKMRALGDREWQLADVATGTATLDSQRVTQALLQLADNAVKHTRPGDTIILGSHRSGGLVRFRVVDEGDGVPAADREMIFERFGRSTVAPGDEGFGLGLSIVRAIALAHGGSITLDDGPRTSFTLSIPIEEDTWHTS